MKAVISFLIIPFVAMLLLISCSKDDFNVPPASTQAKFTWTVEVVTINDQPAFKVTFINQSIEALTYFWDFGNGQTSTEQNPVVYYTEEGNYTVTLTVTSATNLYYNKLTETQNLRLILKIVHFEENFDEESSIDNFILIDADGDGFNWYWDSYEGDGYLLSRSWSSQTGPLTPDNWIITPAIDLTQVESGKEIWLNFTVCPTANTPIYRTEHYAVLVSTTGTEIADFQDVVWEETLTMQMVNWEYQLREIDISQFAGQTIRIAFRHFDSYDLDRISLNDFEVFSKP